MDALLFLGESRQCTLSCPAQPCPWISTVKSGLHPGYNGDSGSPDVHGIPGFQRLSQRAAPYAARQPAPSLSPLQKSVQATHAPQINHGLN
jgi:hypothetical protein